MNVNIEKITNGYILTVDGVKTFCDVPEAICGHMAEQILEYCKALDAKKPGKSDELNAAMAQAMAQLTMAEPGKLKLLDDPSHGASILPDWMRRTIGWKVD